jgi:predicted outer membrane repeat protein
MKKQIFLFWVCLFLAVPCSAETIYVDDAAAGANNGSSWANAYNYLQDALAACCSGDEIRVAQGIYKPDKGAGVTPGDREATFQLISGVALYGGFPSGGGSWEDRDPNTYESILSGDLTGNDEPVDNPADLLADPNRAENSYQIVSGSGADETAILDGFTVMGGNANGSYPNSRGGGLFQCDGPISNCTIRGNSAVESGGGLYVCTGPITKCTISNNSANYGGGIYRGSLTIIDCIFIGNVSQTSGGGWDAPSDSRLINCLFSGNRTGGAGGAIFCPCTSIEMINCTVTGNVAEGEGFYRGGGICGDDDTDMFLTNCIFWGNRDFDGMIESSQIWQDYVDQTHVNHCCVQGWTGILGGTDNHGNNPRFVDPDGADDIAGTLDDNLRLQANSYCVNAGDNDAVPPSVLTDLDGNQRIFDGVVDQGAYENASTEPLQIAHWKLDESGGDIAEDSAWNHDGKLQGDPIWRPQCGRIAGALEFDGQGDYVNCGNDSNFNITGAITLAAWIKTESSSGKKTILAKHDDAWRIRIQNGNFELVLPGLSSEQWFTVSGSAVNDNHWHHVLGVYDGHSIASVYIDGSPDASREATGSLNTNDEDVCIGRNSLLPERDFVGRIDDVQVYDYALTDDEIADLAHPPTIYHVDAAATGEKNGFCWSDAFVELQTALAAAESGDQIWMAAGSYLPDYDLNTGSHTGDRHASFLLQKDIVIQGGYAGYGAADPYERDIQKYETILSGDLMGNDAEGIQPVNLLGHSSRGDNCYTVILASNASHDAILDGVTIYGGQSNVLGSSTPLRCGGGIYMEWSKPTLRNCRFLSNAARWCGGGILNIHNGMPWIEGCVFVSNYRGWCGGGMCDEYSSPILRDCRFERNFAGIGGGFYGLGGRYNQQRCIHSGNTATFAGGGLFVYEYGEEIILSNCIFSGNRASSGGAVSMDSEVNGTMMLLNCTIAENQAEEYIGGIYYPGATMRNCIFWGNSDPSGQSEAAQIGSSGSDINYCCVQGWTGQWPGVDNIKADPCFVERGYWDANGLWVEGDYYLLPDSPCIDAGDPNYIAEPNETDLDGRPRVIGGRIDMGAYEYSPTVPAEVRIIPKTINLASKGKSITCYIWLPDEYDVADIDPDSIFLEDDIKPEKFSADQQKQVAIAKFNREDVQAVLEVGDIKLKITGQLNDGISFEAAVIIRVVGKK